MSSQLAGFLGRVLRIEIDDAQRFVSNPHAPFYVGDGRQRHPLTEFEYDLACAVVETWGGEGLVDSRAACIGKSPGAARGIVLTLGYQGRDKAKEERRARKNAARLTRYWENPEESRRKRRESKRRMTTPETLELAREEWADGRGARSNAQRRARRANDPEWAAKERARCRARDAAIRQKHGAAVQGSAEHRLKISLAASAKRGNPPPSPLEYEWLLYKWRESMGEEAA